MSVLQSVLSFLNIPSVTLTMSVLQSVPPFLYIPSVTLTMSVLQPVSSFLHIPTVTLTMSVLKSALPFLHLPTLITLSDNCIALKELKNTYHGQKQLMVQHTSRYHHHQYLSLMTGHEASQLVLSTGVYLLLLFLVPSKSALIHVCMLAL
ncbi:hypothetical protein BsWGS_19908 [Bradybaena similaris]